MPAAPSCFGFEIASELAFRFPRCGGGELPLRVIERTGGAPRTPSRPLFQVVERGRRIATLVGEQGSYDFAVRDIGAYRVTPADGLIEVPPGADPIRRELVMWGIPATLCFAARGDLSIHAAAVEVAGGAVLLAAPGHHGKTTLAVAFHRAGYRILTEDSACCCFLPAAHVRPGPGLVRWRGRADQIPDGMELTQTRNGRSELAISVDRRGDAAPVPVRAVVFLRESDAEPRLIRREAHAALRDLWALNFAVGGADVHAHRFERVADLASAVPCWDLTRRMDSALLDETVERIVEAVT